MRLARRDRPAGWVRAVLVVASAWLAGFLLAEPAFAQFCMSDPECDDGMVCNGVETCDLGMNFCQPGTPVVCNDGDPCTADFCSEPAGTCGVVPSQDPETAAGPDGICNTTDDNLPLSGTDGVCGTMDDLTGDGVCSLLDNCDLAFNPGQEDADGDFEGDACDATPCLARGLYAISGSVLYRVDPNAPSATFVASGFPGATDVVVDPTETQAVVTSRSSNTVWVVDLITRTITNSLARASPATQPGLRPGTAKAARKRSSPQATFRQGNTIGMSGPWGVDLGASGDAYIVERDSGQITRFDLFGGFIPVAFGLSGPTGIDVNAAETTAYVAEATTGELSSVNLQTGAVTLIAGGLSNPLAVALDPSETSVYVVEQGANRLSRVTISGGTVTTVTSSLFNPQGIALDATGSTAYVTDSSSGFPGISAVNLSNGTVTPLNFPMGSFIPFNDGLALSPRPPVVLSVPDSANGIPASSVTVPVSVDDVTGLGVLSADFTVRFNPAVLMPTSVAAGSLTGGCTVTSNISGSGQAVVSVFCSSDIAGSGSIAEITFSVGGARGQGSPLDVVSPLLNEGTPPVCGDDGRLFVPVEIGGTVVYYRDHTGGTEPSTKPVDGAVVDLSRFDFDPNTGMTVLTPAGSSTTDCAGSFNLPGIEPILEYQVLPGKTGDFGGAVDPFDAALNAQHVVGLITLTPKQRLAADVSGNGTLTSFDSARIAQFSVGTITQFQVAVIHGSDWAFFPVPQAEPNQSVQVPVPSSGSGRGRIEFHPIVESAENQDFLGILFGDVSGNWQPVCPGAAPGSGTPDAATVGTKTVLSGAGAEGASGAAAVQQAGGRGGGSLILPDLKAAPGDLIQVPVRAEGAAAAVAFYLDLRFDPDVLRLVSVGRGAGAPAFSLTTNLGEPGRARLALFHALPLGADGEIASATFEVVGRPGSRTALTLPAVTVNEGAIPVSVKKGSVVVLPPTSGR